MTPVDQPLRTDVAEKGIEGPGDIGFLHGLQPTINLIVIDTSLIVDRPHPIINLIVIDNWVIVRWREKSTLPGNGARHIDALNIHIHGHDRLTGH